MIELHPADAAPAIGVILKPEGLHLQLTRDGRLVKRVLPWGDVERLVDEGLPPRVRWGLVLDGELREVVPTEAIGRDRLAESRSLGFAATLVKLPADPV